MGETTNIFATQTAIALISGYLLNWAKSSPLVTFMNRQTVQLNHIVAALLAALTSVGITATWTAATHTLTISNLTLSAIGLLVWNWFKQYAYQHTSSKFFELVQSLDKLSSTNGGTGAKP